MDTEHTTLDQRQRETILFDLRQLIACQSQYTHLVSPYGNTLWIHVTDLQRGSTDGIIIIGDLINAGVLKAVDVPYQMQGDWHDRFAPYAYVLTGKALDILTDPGLWVFNGEWVDNSNERLKKMLPKGGAR
jgi:hypothetical protein